MKISPRFFPTIIMILALFAAVFYIPDGLSLSGNWRKVVYWLAAAALTYVVTW